MVNIFNFIKIVLKNTYVRYFSILTAAWLIYSLLKEGKVFGVNELNSYQVVILFLISMVVALLIYLYQSFCISFSCRFNNIDEHLSHRIGSTYSQKTSCKTYYDNIHHYNLLWRQDLLDCESGNYYSFRCIEGVNVSPFESCSLVYCESADFKLPFAELSIDAVDLDSGESLFVEPLNNPLKKCVTHPFRIHFKRPLMKNQRFNVAYSIFIPNELACLDCDNEIMSVSLCRMKRGLDELNFNICLNYKPKSVRVYKKNKYTGKMSLVNNANVIIDEYNPSCFLEERYRLKWSSSPYKISWKCINPASDLYVIQYIK